MAKEFHTYEDLVKALNALTPDDILPSVSLTPALAEAILAHDPVNRDLRKANVEKLKREITGGFWDHRKSSLMRFLESDGRLSDGQHRCRAVLEAGQAIIVHMATAPDTIGMDQGATRTLADQLRIHANISDKVQRDLASTVTKRLCPTQNANDRELITFFETNKAFILECVMKPIEWLADKEPAVMAVMKPSLFAVTRAMEIHLYEQPPTEVDELLEDIINAGVTAPEGSPRREAAKQIWDAMQSAFTKRGPKQKDVLKWVQVALEQKRKGSVKNIMLARFSRKGRRKKAA
jgi:hypothetical protein